MAGREKPLGPAALRFASNLRRIRRYRELTAAALSARLSEIGQPIRDTSICKIEKGTRHVDIDDLVALAQALEVPVGTLLFGDVTISAEDAAG